MIAATPSLEAPVVPFPRAPRTLAEAGLPVDLVVQLILKYGTPAEGLGRGPVFRLTPAQVTEFDS